MNRVSCLFVVFVLSAAALSAQTPPTPPPSPAPKTYTVSMTWSWSKGSGPDASGFIVERRARPTGEWAEVQRVAGDQRAATDTAPAGTYEYRIRAFNAMGTGAPSNVLTVIVGPPAPARNLMLHVQAAVSTALAQRLGERVGTGA
jgi:hypothetical protein